MTEFEDMGEGHWTDCFFWMSIAAGFEPQPHGQMSLGKHGAALCGAGLPGGGAGRERLTGRRRQLERALVGRCDALPALGDLRIKEFKRNQQPVGHSPRGTQMQTKSTV